MGKALGDARKIVVSNQNLQFTWRNSEQLRGDLAEAVTALKNGAWGNGYRYERIHLNRPSVAGRGSPRRTAWSTPSPARKGACTTRGESPIPLLLVSSQAFTTGVLYLIYARSESTPVGT